MTELVNTAGFAQVESFGPYSVVCRTLTVEAVDEVVRLMAEIRGQAAVDALRVDAASAS